MKIFSADQSREADKATLVSQQITSLDLMERAGHEVFLWLKKSFPDKETFFHVYCGRGNNGGDGLVVASLLHNDNYKIAVKIIDGEGGSIDFLASLDRLKHDGIETNSINEPVYKIAKTIIVDALFGTGLNRELDNAVRELIVTINNSNAQVIAIDVPSGMFLDKKTEFAVKAHTVLTFQNPKLAFYLAGNYQFIQNVEILDIGLDATHINNTPSNHYITDSTVAANRYKPTHHYAHKGTQGHALIIGGSHGKIGAAILSAKAALMSGCGLVTAYIPECGYTALQSAFPEAMVLTNGDKYIKEISFDLEPKAVGLGMGLGQHKDTQLTLYDFLKRFEGALVLDADALTILSYNKDWLELLPPDTILTPHPKELERLMGIWQDDFEKIEMMEAFAKKYSCILVAKDAYTMIVCGTTVQINTSGNAALATGGSGDVLTGIITGLLAQGYAPIDAAVLGTYLHGLTADIAVPHTGTQSFIASTILEYLGRAFLQVEKASH